jgi:hypothetical protein
MRFARGLLLAAVALLGAVACADAKAATSVRVTVSPGSISPGGQVQVQGSCGDNSNTATVTSSAFGSVTVTPSAGQIVTKVTVPASTPAGTFDVRLTCATGAQATTKLTVLATSSAAPSVPGPDTGGGFLADRDGDARGADGGADGADDRYAGLPPVGWLAIGAASLLAAAALLVRAQRQTGRNRPDQAGADVPSAASSLHREGRRNANEIPRTQPDE